MYHVARKTSPNNPIKPSRRQVVGGLAALSAPVAPLLATAGCSRAGSGEQSLETEESLRVRAEKSGFYFGAAVMADQLRDDKPFREAIIRECNMLVHENELKWPFLQRKAGAEYDFRNADYVVDFAQQHNMTLRGLPLVWHYGLPDRVENSVNATTGPQIMIEHINKVVRRYAGRMHSWDVLNEAIDPEDGREDGLRDTVWLRAMGPEYVDMAFETAAKADPDALLIYNDHALTYGRERHDLRRAAVIKLVKRLQGNGIPIHGIGLQMHLSVGKHPFNEEAFVRFLDDAAELGMRVYSTEMDVGDQNAPADLALRDQLVADEYKKLVDILVEHPAVDMIVAWGLSDKYTWWNHYGRRLDGLPQRPLPLDHKMRRKKSWKVLAEAFDRRAERQDL